MCHKPPFLRHHQLKMNKLIGLIIIGIIVLVMTGCNKQSVVTSTSINDSENTSNLLNLNSRNSSVETKNMETLLEVHTQTSGMVYPQGTILEIKLYSTGEAEMDYYLTPSNYVPTNDRTPTKTQRKNVLLEANDFQTLKNLTETVDFMKAKSQYPPSFSGLSDVSTTTTIISKYKNELKKIVLEETDSSLHLEKKKGVYPESLINLLDLIKKQRLRYEKD